MADLLITGASGYLAHRLVPLATEIGDVIAVSRTEPDHESLAGAEWRSVDLLDADAIDRLVADCSPRAIVHAAAVNPGQRDSFDVNPIGTANVARAASSLNSRLVVVSSDVVFDGLTGPYADDASPNPVNDYGASKAEAERAAQQACPSAAIVRTSLIYGLDRIDRGTAGFKERLARGEPLSLWTDAMRQPVWIDALCGGLLRLATEHPDEAGTMNLAGDQRMSRADFAHRLLAFWGVDLEALGEGMLTTGSVVGVPAQPVDLSLLHERADALGLATPGVDEVLAAAN